MKPGYLCSSDSSKEKIMCLKSKVAGKACRKRNKVLLIKSYLMGYSEGPGKVWGSCPCRTEVSFLFQGGQVDKLSTDKQAELRETPRLSLLLRRWRPVRPLSVCFLVCFFRKSLGRDLPRASLTRGTEIGWGAEEALRMIHVFPEKWCLWIRAAVSSPQSLQEPGCRGLFRACPRSPRTWAPSLTQREFWGRTELYLSPFLASLKCQCEAVADSSFAFCL